MNSNKLRLSMAGAVSALALALVVSAGPAAAAPAETVVPAAVVATTAAVTQVTPQEAAGLAFMREEEKLARDVYQYLYQLWKLPTFKNIATSEQTHMDAIKTLLDRYQLADPAAGNAAGVFTNAELQDLYDQLIAQGSISSAEALKVGATIEKVDIADLQDQLALTTNADITTVYKNLLRGSQNHLRAFTSTRGGGRSGR